MLKDRVALITGGASGLGLVVARRFIEAGARVAILDRNPETPDRVCAELGDAVVAVCGDVTSYDDNRRAVEATVAAFGKLDVFVGNAGIFDNYATLADIPAEKLSAAFDELFGIDVKGYILGAKAALDELRRAKGTIVFTASISSFRPGYGGMLYIAAKHAVAGLTKRLALELAPDVRVNAVAPGFMPTTLSGIRAIGQTPKDLVSKPPLERFPLGFYPETDDFAGLYVLLASPDSRIVTGQVILADAGSSLKRA